MKTKISLLLAVTLAAVAGCKYDRTGKSAASVSGGWPTLTRLPCVAAPANTELLDESGSLALFVGETAEDLAVNGAEEKLRNSLFLRRGTADGTYEWRMILTTDSDWRTSDKMGSWSPCYTLGDLTKFFFVRSACFASDERHLWLVCDSDSDSHTVACSYDVYDCAFRFLLDGGFDVEEELDGTILVCGVRDKKLGQSEDCGVTWYNVWITPCGKIVRKEECPDGQ